MAVYVDASIWHHAGRRWCHLLADDEAELHRFALLLGIKPSSYQGPPRTSAPHYDITAFERDRAVRMGALECGREEIVAVYRRVRVERWRPQPSCSVTPVSDAGPMNAQPAQLVACPG